MKRFLLILSVLLMLCSCFPDPKEPPMRKGDWIFRRNAGDTFEILYYKGKKASPLELPSEFLGKPVTGIAFGAFEDHVLDNCRVVIPGGMIKIGTNDENPATGHWVFENQDNLTVEFATGVTRIPENIFRDAEGLTSVVIPDTVSEIGNKAFFGCKGLKEVVLPAGLIAIGESAFSGSGLETIDLPGMLMHIGSLAFKDVNVPEITVPESVSSVGKKIFSGWKYPKVIYIEGKTSGWESGWDSECSAGIRNSGM